MSVGAVPTEDFLARCSATGISFWGRARPGVWPCLSLSLRFRLVAVDSLLPARSTSSLTKLPSRLSPSPVFVGPMVVFAIISHLLVMPRRRRQRPPPKIVLPCTGGVQPPFHYIFLEHQNRGRLQGEIASCFIANDGSASDASSDNDCWPSLQRLAPGEYWERQGPNPGPSA